jgi:hypothetical protein
VSARPRVARRRAVPGTGAAALFAEQEATLLDLVDNILNKGLMVTGDLVLSLADVDLVYVRLSALLSAVDKVLPSAGPYQPKASARGRRRP